MISVVFMMENFTPIVITVYGAEQILRVVLMYHLQMTRLNGYKLQSRENTLTKNLQLIMLIS